MVEALRKHWPEYLIEAWGLGAFMVAASVVASILDYTGSPVRQALGDAWLRRLLTGLAMGLTAVGIIYSPWGKRSGAHINPAVTLTFWRLGKISACDAAFYVAAQFAGGVAGMTLASALLTGPIADPSVRHVATLPGPGGPWVAFGAEAVISAILMGTVLATGNARRLAPWTGLFAGLLVAAFITVEGPFSGMSMNPARSFASAWSGGVWTAFWVYLTAPVLGMLAAAQIYTASPGVSRVLCAKLHHENDQRCIFNCDYPRCAATGRA